MKFSNHFYTFATLLYNRIGRSENKGTMQLSRFKNEVRPGVVHTLQEFLSAEVKIFVLIKQCGHIWPPYRLKKKELAEKLTTVISTPGLTSFSNDKNCFISFIFRTPSSTLCSHPV